MNSQTLISIYKDVAPHNKESIYFRQNKNDKQ